MEISVVAMSRGVVGWCGGGRNTCNGEFEWRWKTDRRVGVERRAGVQGADAGRRSSERGRLLPNAVGVGLKVVQSGWF